MVYHRLFDFRHHDLTDNNGYIVGRSCRISRMLDLLVWFLVFLTHNLLVAIIQSDSINTTMVSSQSLIASHSVCFVAGFALGKYVDYEELKSYRSSHESFGQRWRRRAGTAVLGIACMGTMMVLASASSSRAAVKP